MPEAFPSGAAPDLMATLEEIASQCQGDPLCSRGHAGGKRPPHARGSSRHDGGGAAAFPNAQVREAAIFLLLDAEPAVRKAAIKELQAHVSGLTPDSLRRLIAMRNWLPEAERSGADALIRAARADGIACAPWQEAGTDGIMASAIDGSGARGFLIVTRAGRKKRLSSVLLKTGVLDAWAGPPETKASIQNAIDQAGSQTPMIAVSRAYLDQTISDYLSRGFAAGVLPPAGLL